MPGLDEPGVPNTRSLLEAVGVKYRSGIHPEIKSVTKWNREKLPLVFLKEQIERGISATGDIRRVSPTGSLINKQNRVRELTLAKDIFFLKLDGPLSIVTYSEVDSHKALSANREVPVKVVAVVKTELLKDIMQSYY